MALQAPSAVVLVRPHCFSTNPETEPDNQFQSQRHGLSSAELADNAYRESTELAETLTELGIKVHLFEDEQSGRPDSVFPNNWISTHPGGHIALYPMYSNNRRAERRYDIVEMLKDDYRVQEVLDFSGLEHDGIFLEGTGAMVLDHQTRLAYVCRSNRANPIALERFCARFGYEPMAFDAVDQAGNAVYHTNVMMCIGTDIALLAPDLIPDEGRRHEVMSRLSGPGRDIVELDNNNIEKFAGNAIELDGASGKFLAMSDTAASSLSSTQRNTIETHVPIVEVRVPTIELAGGSLRCMVAGIHLDPRLASGRSSA